MALLVTVDEDTAVAPYHVVSLRVGCDAAPRAWGVFVTLAGVRDPWFRPAKEDTRESARELMADWRRALNEGI